MKRLFILFLFLNCASATPSDNNTEDPFYTMELSASQYLEMGFNLFQDKQFARAALFFQAAIKTGNLNDRGRAMCYWFIGQSNQALNNKDEAAEAYLFFTIVAQDIIENTYEINFVQESGILINLEYATRFIETLWQERTGTP